MTTMPGQVTADRRMIVRTMEADDVAALHALSKAEQWPHRQEDLADMLAVGEGVVAEMGGEIVGTTMWWPVGPAAASLGMVIVARSHRGAGLGRIVMEAALDRVAAAMGPDATVILNATADGVPLYRRLGFNGYAEVLQHQGTSFAAPLVPLDAGERIRPMGTRDRGVVAALVQAATGLERPATMDLLFDKAHGIVIDREGSVTAVALFRRFGRGYVVGPVVAPDRDRAQALIAQWLGSRSGDFTRLDIMGDSGLGDWLEDLGLVRVGRVVTMARGQPPVRSGPARSFSIVSQALC